MKIKLWKIIYTAVTFLILVAAIIISNTVTYFESTTVLKVGFGIASVLVYAVFAGMFLFGELLTEKYEFFTIKKSTRIMITIGMLIAGCIALI